AALVGTGSPLTLTGGLKATATQTARTTTEASGDTKGGSAGIGLSLALVIANHDVEALLKRDLTAPGDAAFNSGAVSFQANGVSTNDTEAEASSAGAKATDTDTSGKDVNKKADDNISTASANDKSGKTSSTKSPDAKSGENGGTKVTVAAAVAIGIITANAVAKIADSIHVVTTGGAAGTGLLKLSSSEDTDSTVKASGKASKAATANIGAAVALNLVHIDNEAVVGADDLLNVNGLNLTAAMNAAGDGKNTLDAEATSGAGSGKVGIAGSLALTTADVKTNAEIHAMPNRGPPGDNLNGHDLTLSATASVSNTDKAMANDKDAGTVGVGAGAAIGVVNDTTTASIDAGALLSGLANVSLTATSSDTEVVYGEAGTDNGSGATLAFTADAAISLPTVITTAVIAGDGTDANQNLTATGTINVKATQTTHTTTTAKADATTGSVVIGLALALAIPDDEVIATSSRTISGSSVTFSATGSSANNTEADASAAGAKGDGGSGDGSGKDVNGKADDQLKSANKSASDNGTGGSKTSDTSNAKAQTSDKNSGGGNTVTVAGAAAINVVTTVSEASVSEVPSGETFPTSPSAGQIFRLVAPVSVPHPPPPP